MSRRKKATAQNAGAEEAIASNEAVPNTPVEPVEEPHHRTEHVAAAQAEPSADTPKRQFRSWVVNAERGYARLSDDVNQRIVLQFAERPEVEILAAVKQAGFQFKPDYYGQKNCWVRRNDFEGRVAVEGVEKLVTKAVVGTELPEF
jgi:hypothetical protein